MVEVNNGAMLTVEKMVSYLSGAYVSLIKRKIPIKKFPSVMLWGPPGVGKSQGVREIAERISRETGKCVDITDVRLLLFNPVDLRGIPTANADKTLAVWLKPKIFQMDESEDVVNILFLDEISAAPPSVQAAAYQITLDRIIGEHRLPENCIVLAAGNRITDKSVAYAMPRALANRLCHLEIYSDYNSWHNWAIEADIHESVIGFLDFKPEYLMCKNAPKSSNSFATPRSWEMVSNVLKCVSDELSDVFPIIVGCVGEEAANSFAVWYNVFQNVPPVDKIFAGTHTILPQLPNIIFALTTRIVSYAREHHEEKEIDNALKYVSRLSVEFRNKVFFDLLKIREVRPVLKNNSLFCEWFEKTNKKWEHYPC